MLRSYHSYTQRIIQRSSKSIHKKTYHSSRRQQQQQQQRKQQINRNYSTYTSDANTLFNNHDLIDPSHSTLIHTRPYSSFHDDHNHENDELHQLINEYSQKPQTSVSLQTLTRTAKGELLNKSRPNNNDNDNTSSSSSSSSSSSRLMYHQNTKASHEVLTQVASFIHHELPIRLARRIKDLQKVPYLSEMPSVQAVKDIYISSFLTLIHEPNPRDNGGMREPLFARKLELLYERHSSVLVQMAKGAYELRDKVRRGEISDGPFANANTKNNDSSSLGRSSSSSSSSEEMLEFEHMRECHAFLDRFYVSRIGIRVVAGQYLALRLRPREGYIGLICQETSPYEVVKEAITDASYMCECRYGGFPNVIIKGRLDLTFPYIPTQLHYILLELLKNAMRATVEHHGVQNIHKWPAVEVIIADGFSNEDVVIKIADVGGGISRSNMNKIWSYLFTTADSTIQDGLVSQDNQVDHSVEAPLAGLGYGLPISKSYARYFGGDVSINSMDGYGTDAFVHLRRLGDTREPLPF